MVRREPVGAVMVVGGGIAGIQAALDLADAGFFVHLVEKQAGIGGSMARLDKTYPTNDCTLCILSPKLVECGRHMNIELHTLTEVEEVQGEEGDFRVTLRRKPRYVDVDKCIACGLCAEKCPAKAPDAFNMGLNQRKAAYIYFGQSVPLKYAIDPERCIYLQKGKCRACEKFCPSGAIFFEDKEQTREIQVGSVILTPGFTPFNPKGYGQFGYGRIPDVVTGLEFERLLSASGPCQGHLVRPSDQTEPRRIAWIQCVGSRAMNPCDNRYCSTVCCMYAIKESLVTAEHVRGRPEMAIFYIDMRTQGKGFDRYYNQAVKQGVRFVRSRPDVCLPGPDGKGVTLGYMSEDGGEYIREDFDMVVLSTGMEIAPESLDLARRMGVNTDRYGFARASTLSPMTTNRPGIFVSGCFKAPMDVPTSVSQASAAAASASERLSSARGSLTKTHVYPKERSLAGQSKRVGVFVCSCGNNISSVVDVQAVAEYARSLPDVVLVENNQFTCSTDTQKRLAQCIQDHSLNRIVIAACSPKTHEPLFRETLREAGLNEYLVEMANIRNLNSWVHRENPGLATSKAKDQVRAAVAKVRLLAPLTRQSISVTRKALVVGGGAAGLTAALGFAEQGIETMLLEKEPELGGNARRLKSTWSGEAVRPWLDDLIEQAGRHPLIHVRTGARLRSALGSVGQFQSEVEFGGRIETYDYGVAVIATGGKEYKPEEYLYGQDSRVMTLLEFDQVLEERSDDLQSVAFIQCVGSREPQRPYCSRVCCTHTAASALALKKKRPQAGVYVLNRDVRTYGQREEVYLAAREHGVIYVRYALDDKPRVFTEGEALFLEAFDPVLRQRIRVPLDALVLATAILPNADKALVDLYKCGVNQDGFLLEAHPKLRPVDLPVDGVFAAGLCHYPKPIEEAIAQAKAAVSRAMTVLARDSLALSAEVAFIDAKKCTGCGVCWEVCPYKAISPADQGLAQVNESLCKGCGLCVASCRSGALNLRGFTHQDILAQIEALV